MTPRPNNVEAAVDRLELLVKSLRDGSQATHLAISQYPGMVADDIDLLCAEVSRLRSRGGEYD